MRVRPGIFPFSMAQRLEFGSAQMAFEHVVREDLWSADRQHSLSIIDRSSELAVKNSLQGCKPHQQLVQLQRDHSCEVSDRRGTLSVGSNRHAPPAGVDEPF